MKIIKIQNCNECPNWLRKWEQCTVIEGFPACNEGILPECPLDEYHQSQLHEKNMEEAWDCYTDKCLFANTKEEEAVQAGFYRGWQAAMHKRMPNEEEINDRRCNCKNNT